MTVTVTAVQETTEPGEAEDRRDDTVTVGALDLFGTQRNLRTELPTGECAGC